MKITKEKLKQIIKEELDGLSEWHDSPDTEHPAMDGFVPPRTKPSKRGGPSGFKDEPEPQGYDPSKEKNPVIIAMNDWYEQHQSENLTAEDIMNAFYRLSAEYGMGE